MEKKYIYRLHEGKTVAAGVFGGKAANLNRLVDWGFNVPSGFLIDADAFELFVLKNNLSTFINRQLRSLRVKDIQSYSSAAKIIQRRINTALLPMEVSSELQRELLLLKGTRFAVRSSAAFEDSDDNSWAGQFDSYLNVKTENIPAYIKKCWASFFNSRAMLYRTSLYKNVHRLRLAVVVQEMVKSDVSGIAFSEHPQTGNTNQIIIESIKGLGDKLVSGKKVEDTFLLEKTTGRTLSFTRHSRQALLSAPQLQDLANTVTQIEAKFQYPVDVEWAISDKQLYILQARPVTGHTTSTVINNLDSDLPDIRSYELTFKVSGLSFLFTDMLARGFAKLDPLFTSDKNKEFRQYFTNEKMQFAAEQGKRLYKKPDGFKIYKQKFSKYYETHLSELENILSQSNIKLTHVRQFFNILSKLFTFYSKMDNQYTNLAYIAAKNDSTIRQNLNLLAGFKDFARIWINNTVLEQNSHFERFINKLAVQFGLPVSDVENYCITEINDLFKRKYTERDVLKDRQKGFVIYKHDSGISYVQGKQALEFIKNAAKVEAILLNSELQGIIAHVGTAKKIRGKVRVIPVDYSNFGRMEAAMVEMEKGEILVAEFTAPELLTACKKAKAIITDIGGMLSHAAIVSRELNIPCLIGTKIATKVLTTGDLVEINFESSTVKKI